MYQIGFWMPPSRPSVRSVNPWGTEMIGEPAV